MKNINAFIKLHNIKENSVLIRNIWALAGGLILCVMILYFREPIENITEHKLSKFKFHSSIMIFMMFGINLCCIKTLSIKDLENSKNSFKTKRMRNFFNSYDEVIMFNKTITTNIMLLGFALLLYFFFLISYINMFLSNFSYIEFPLWAKIISLIIMISNVIICLDCYRVFLVESIRSKKEFNETLNEKNLSIGLHKGRKLVSAYSMYELLGYIKDGYSCDEKSIKKTLFN